MLLPELPKRRSALLCLALLTACTVAGCFRPLYASVDNSGSEGPGRKLALIEIASAGDDRTSIMLRNKLSFKLTGGAQAPAPRYKLTLSTTLVGSTAIIDSLQDTPQIDTMTMTTDFSLVSLDNNTVLFKAKANARKSYGSGLQRYGTVRASTDAIDEAADTIADQIRTRLGIYFAENPAS